MSSKLTVIFLLFLCTAVMAEEASLVRVSRLDAYSYPWGMVDDGSGNFYIAGDAVNVTTGLDYVIVKFNSSGDTLWSRQYIGPGSSPQDDGDEVRDICLGPSGNVFITGRSAATNDSPDYATLGYDSNGNNIFLERYNGIADFTDEAFGITVDSDGNVYVTGYTRLPVFADFLTIKYRSNGDTAWTRDYDGYGDNDIANDVYIDGDGNVYITGSSYRSATGDDIATIKYDSVGTEQWAFQFDGEGSGPDLGKKIIVDNSGYSYVLARTANTSGNIDISIFKHDTNGDTIWVRTYNGASNGHDYEIDMVIDDFGNIFSAGHSHNGSNYDYVLLKHNSSGDLQWARTYNGTGNGDDYVKAVALDSENNIYITGRSYGGVAESYDVASIKYNQDGDTIWTAIYNSDTGSAYDEGADIIVDDSNYVYVAASLSAASGSNISLIKYEQINPPANDEWENAELLFGDPPWEVDGTTIDSDSDCVGILNYPGVWYKFKPPYDLNLVSVHFCGTDPMPSLYGSNMFLDTVVCADYLTFDGWPTPPAMIQCPGGEYVWDYTYKIPGDDTAWLAVMTGYEEDRQDFHLSIDIEQAAPDYNAYWEAASGSLPDETCPAWTLTNTADIEVPLLSADTLILSTSDAPELMAYIMDEPIILMPDTIEIEFMARYESGTDLTTNRTGCYVNFTILADNGNYLYIDQDEIFTWSSYGTVSGQSFLDTDDNFHKYRIEIEKLSGDFDVYYDDSLIFSGSTITHSNFADYALIYFGDGTTSESAISSWLYFRHNAYAFDTDFDEDGVTDSCDNCPTVYNPNQQDTDGDGTGDWCEGPIVVTNLDDSGEGSLRWAIDSANTDPALNYIEFDVSGTIALVSPLPNITGHQTNIVGSSAPGGSKSVILDGTGLGDVAGLTLVSNLNSVRGLTLTNWDDRCIQVSGSGNIVSGCHININAAGDTRAAGLGHGISVSGNDNIIGGSVPVSRNVVATPDAGVGIYIIGGSGNRINNNYVGLSSSGGQLPNPPGGFAYGIRVSNADSNMVGDTASFPNYIADVTVAIELTGSGGNEIENNIMGLSAAKADTIGNNDGVVFTSDSKSNIFGPGNIIAGASSHGMTLNPGCDSNTIIGNIVAGNGGQGIMLTSGPMHNTIGGYNVGEGNTISDNFENGIYIYGNSDTNQIIGNTIGGELGNPGGGNNRNGITIEMNCDLILVDSNTIGYNRDDGITVEINSRRNTISRNRIFFSDEMGIDLADDGITQNDPGDIDTGPNELRNYPVIDSALMNLDSSFTVYGSAIHDGIIEFFLAHPGGHAGLIPDITGHGEAYEYIGTTTGDVNGDFTFVIPNSYPFYSEITTTATDSIGNTSEFSENFTLIPQPLTIVCASSSGLKRECPSLVNIKVYDPAGDSIGYDADGNFGQSIFPAEYYETVTNCDDSVVIPYPLLGEYLIVVFPDPDNPPGEEPTYTVGVQLDGSTQYIVGEGQLMGGSSATHSFTVEEPIAGDANGDDTVNILDITFLIAFLYQEGPAPFPEEAGDANCDTTINILDITYLIAFLYQDGPPPGC